MKHKETGEFMVLKELYRFDEDAQKNFLKEVSIRRKGVSEFLKEVDR